MSFTFILRSISILFVFFLFTVFASAQQIEYLDSGHSSSLRGMSIYENKYIGVSGNKGMVGLSKDAGKSWTWQQVKGYENRDFRDIHIIDASQILIMAIDTPAILLKSNDGGQHWKLVFSDSTPGMFLDALDFSNKQKGIVIGDPIAGKAFIATTQDGGEHWEKNIYTIPLKNGEAFFASSGSNIHLKKTGDFFAVSGGSTSRLISSKQNQDLPIVQGTQSTGANSIAVSGDHIVIVGGDFMSDQVALKNCIISNDGGLHFQEPSINPHGYRSCVKFVTSKKLVACGTSGVDISKDGGMLWKQISQASFHVCETAIQSRYIYFAGSKGRIARIRKDLIF